MFSGRHPRIIVQPKFPSLLGTYANVSQALEWLNRAHAQRDGPKLREIVDQTYLAGPRLRLLPLDGRVHFLVHSWSSNCYLGFQSAAVTAEVASSSLVVPAIHSKELGHFCRNHRGREKCALRALFVPFFRCGYVSGVSGPAKRALRSRRKKRLGTRRLLGLHVSPG